MVIIDNIPSSTTDTDFHLLIVKKSNLTNINGGGHALPVGFVLVPTPTATIDDDGYYDWTFVRKYDVYNEEISNNDKPMDELSLKNLLLALRNGELYHCTIQYDQFMKNNTTTPSFSIGGTSSPNDDDIGQYGNNSNGNQCLPSWDVLTSMINSNFLHVCHDIQHGCKIVPSSNIGSRGSNYGSTTTDTANNDDDDDVTNNTAVEDGKLITYPAIPCIDTTITNNIRLVTRHTGTRLYLSTLSPKERTRLLFYSSSVNDADIKAEEEHNNNNAEYLTSNYTHRPVGESVFEDVLKRYNNDINHHNGISSSRGEEYFLADIELSFLLFIHLECHVSLEHWRDSISMCALATITAAAVRSSTKPTTTSIVYRRSSFFHTLLSILYQQLLCIEVDFFREVEYSAGEENFLIVALQRLYSACDTAQQQSDSVDTAAAAAASKRKRGNDSSAAAASTIENLKSASLKLKRLLIDRFGLDLSTTTNKEIDDVADDDDDDDMESDALWSTTGHDYVNDEEHPNEIAGLQQEGNTRESMDIGHVKDSSNNNTDDDDEDEDDDGPVIIPYEDVEASLARSTLLKTINQRQQLQVGKAQQRQCEKYPLLYAAMSSGEDEVMACARILDEARDVSLVREAASYLEEVEVHREWENVNETREKKGDIFSLGSSRINKYKC
jgi:A1 cistron-splicing factor AAR2